MIRSARVRLVLAAVLSWLAVGGEHAAAQERFTIADVASMTGCTPASERALRVRIEGADGGGQEWSVERVDCP